MFTVRFSGGVAVFVCGGDLCRGVRTSILGAWLFLVRGTCSAIGYIKVLYYRNTTYLLKDEGKVYCEEDGFGVDNYKLGQDAKALIARTDYSGNSGRFVLGVFIGVDAPGGFTVKVGNVLGSY